MSFTTGLITGIAESVNDALVTDIQRVNKRVDRLTDFRVQRRVKAEEERAKEVKEIEEALSEGRALFDDDPRAAEYAAALLKEQGSVGAYKNFIADLRKRKNETGVNPAGFFARSEVEEPTTKGFTISDYANSYVGSPKALDYALPEGLADGGAGNMLRAFGLGPDITSRVNKLTEEELAARGVGVSADKYSTVSLPDIKFKFEDYTLADKDASFKVKHFNEKLVNPNLTPEVRKQYEDKLDTQLKLASESKDDNIRKSALEQRLSRASIEQRPIIQKEINDINIRIKRREAQAAVDTNEDPMAINKLNRGEAYKRSIDTTLSAEEREKAKKEFYDLGEVISDYSKGEPTVGELYTRRIEDHRRRQVEDPTYKSGNPEFDEEVKQLKLMEGISIGGQAQFATLDDMQTANKMIADISTDPEIAVQIPNNKRFQEIKAVVDAAADKSKAITNLPQKDRKIYDQGILAMRSLGQPKVDDLIDSVKPKEKPSVIAAARLKGYDVSKYEITTPPVTTAGEAAAVTGKEKTGNTPEYNELIKTTPDTVEEASSIVQEVLSDPELKMEDVVKEYEAVGYSNDFIATLKGTSDEDLDQQKEQAIAQKSFVSKDKAPVKEEDKVSEALKFLQGLPARNPLTTSPSEMISKSSKEYEVEKLAEHMNITIDEATKLWTEAYQERNKSIIQRFLPSKSSNKSPSRRTGRVRNKNNGGLMSRNF